MSTHVLRRETTPWSQSPAWQRSAADERINAVTHGLGLVLAALGALVMATSVASRGDRWVVTGCAVYLASLIAVYAMSTLSHGAWPPRWKSLFRRLDQAFIYLLIAATYTPFSVAYLRGPWWWALLATIWVVALLGFASKLFFAHRVEAVSIVSYVLLGWMPIVAAPALMQTLPMGAFWWMLVGGACYSLGTVFLHLDERVRHFHAVWHLCVIAGSACHFAGILFFVVRAAS
jgi:hemolysin III